MIALDLFRGKHPAPSASEVHGVTALLGSIFALAAALAVRLVFTLIL